MTTFAMLASLISYSAILMTFVIKDKVVLFCSNIRQGKMRVIPHAQARLSRRCLNLGPSKNCSHCLFLCLFASFLTECLFLISGGSPLIWIFYGIDKIRLFPTSYCITTSLQNTIYLMYNEILYFA